MSTPELSRKQRIILLILYFFLYLGVYQLLMMPWFYKHLSLNFFRIVQAGINLLFVVGYILVGGRWLKEQFSIFKKKLARNISFAVLTVLLLDLFGVLMSFWLVDGMHLTTAENQANNLAYEAVDPAGFIINALIAAPLAEELVFRGCIFAPLKKNNHFWRGAITAGCLFGFLHVLSSLTKGNWRNLLYFFLYSGCGILLAFPYEATGTICSSMCTHMLYNLFSVLSILAG